MYWYLLRCKPNGQILAKENLKRQGFEVFVPMMIKTSKLGVKFTIHLNVVSRLYFFGNNTEFRTMEKYKFNRGVVKVITFGLLSGCS